MEIYLNSIQQLEHLYGSEELFIETHKEILNGMDYSTKFNLLLVCCEHFRNVIATHLLSMLQSQIDNLRLQTLCCRIDNLELLVKCQPEHIEFEDTLFATACESKAKRTAKWLQNKRQTAKATQFNECKLELDVPHDYFVYMNTNIDESYDIVMENVIDNMFMSAPSDDPNKLFLKKHELMIKKIFDKCEILELFTLCCKYEHIEIAKKMIEWGNIDPQRDVARIVDDRYVVKCAICAKENTFIQMQNATIDHVQETDIYPACIICCVYDADAILDWLISMSCYDIDHLFTIACFYGSLKTAQLLYAKHKANIHAFNDIAFPNCFHSRNSDLVKWLVTLDSFDINARNFEGNTADDIIYARFYHLHHSRNIDTQSSCGS